MKIGKILKLLDTVDENNAEPPSLPEIFQM